MTHSRTKTPLRLLAFLTILTLLLAAVSTAYTQSSEICGNGLDDDGDGYIDGYDLDCAGPPECSPSTLPTFSIARAWQSTGGVHTGMSPTVGDLDGNGMPDLIVSPSNSSVGYRIYAGDGSNLASTATDFVITPSSVNGAAIQPVMADIDRDGTAEVIAVQNTGYVYVFAHTGGNASGTYEFRSDLPAITISSFPRVADMDEDGTPEIVVGNDVFQFDLGAGTLTRVIQGSTAKPYGRGALVADPVVIDILTPADCGGDPACNGKEIVAGSVVYAVDLVGGTLTVQKDLHTIAPSVPLNSDGPTVVADLDLDGDLDVAYKDRANNYFYIWDPLEDALLMQVSPGSYAGIPAVANVYDDTQDGHAIDLPEVLLVMANRVSALNLNHGGPVWSLTTTDVSGQTGIAAFDFNGDGLQEIVYNDQTDLRIIDGNTIPPTNLATFANTSPTWFEHPVIADVDDDGEAEIVAVGSGQVHVFESALDPWQPARTMWNQRGYYVVNVNDDLTIPAGQQATTVELSAGSGQHALNRYNAQFSPASLILNGGCIDLGDAPDPTYPTLAASNGARHGTEDGLLFLGAGVDNDNDGQPDASAAGDDNDAQGNDDDGVVFVSALLLGQQVDVDVTASAAGQLDAWVDFDGNGSWADAGEQIFNVAVAAGVNHLHFTPPGGSTTDPTFARFRLSTAGGLSYDGFAEDGEVEDYGLQFTLPSAVTLASVGIAADSNAAPVILGLMFVLGIVGAGAAWRVSRRR